ncbi:polysaccharide deacetylase [Hephaestia caeni]|uniref:Polysaccharide deacetylase n=1 Tax=Hephaestia caeni TaxID=645617 RepID=A0A397NPZ5_9SPHN|nr:polysaccharide deacetylase family protein [Hephaestia caeni]RIA37749.1 polysaccharide deacetylase [Hephaestia caeni]
MPTPVFLTVDTELAWRHHATGLDAAAIVERSLDPAGVGVRHQLDRLAMHGLKACFFVDPMPALVFGLDWLKPLVATILARGQEVQLHLHPNWAGARAGDGGAAHARFEMVEYSAHEQRDLIAGAIDLLKAGGAPHPIAFRAGSYGANDTTLAALAALGFVYDSSHNGAATPWPSQIGLPADTIAPVVRAGLVELPVTLIEDAPGSLRNVQVCALSIGEIRAALDHAVAADHAAVTIVSHSFELASRAGTRANGIHARRFEALCEMLRARRHDLPTCHFADRPALRLGAADHPLAPNTLRTRWRQAEQLWSNMVEERAA